MEYITTQLTNNNGADADPQINNNGYMVWYGSDGYDNEIFLYDGTTTTQITNNSYSDSNPQINNNGYVVWHGSDGSDSEIFLASPVNTPVGDEGVEVTPQDCPTGSIGGTPVTITFDTVTEGGYTSLCSSETGTPPPSGFMLLAPPTYYEIETTAQYDGNIQVCIQYSGVTGNAKLFHQQEYGGWEDVTCPKEDCPSCPSPNPGNEICGCVSSLSTFAIFAPVADEGPPVGGIAEPINKIQLLLPWMTFATLILLTIAIVVFRRVRKKVDN